jgi:Nucleotidyl transferase AbiEii toxin, Type IV TA system
MVVIRKVDTRHGTQVAIFSSRYSGHSPTKIDIDIGFGDEIVPSPSRIRYPALLDFSCLELIGYTMESTIGEKFQAMVKLGILNSRMKDIVIFGCYLARFSRIYLPVPYDILRSTQRVVHL